MIKTPLRWNQCTQFAEARRDNLKLYLLLFCSNLQTKTKEVSLWRGARRYTHLYLKGKKKKKHNSVTHTAKVNIRVRCVAAGLKFRPGICLLLSAGIYLEFFFFFFFWADILDSRIKVLVSSFCRGHPRVWMLISAWREWKEEGNPPRAAALKPLAQRLT